MLSLLVPGVLMGGSSTADGGAGGIPRLLMLGVGRVWWIPFLFAIGAYRG